MLVPVKDTIENTQIPKPKIPPTVINDNSLFNDAKQIKLT
jgi:hypothetical protein